jgi:hypothetical protein
MQDGEPAARFFLALYAERLPSLTDDPLHTLIIPTQLEIFSVLGQCANGVFPVELIEDA